MNDSLKLSLSQYPKPKLSKELEEQVELDPESVTDFILKLPSGMRCCLIISQKYSGPI